jgi:lysophospholipase L1-like esterase
MSYGKDPNNTYPGWVQKYLGDKYEVINAGCPGWTTAEMLIDFELRLLDFKPDVIVIYAGFNDARRCGLVKGFKSDYTHVRVNKEFPRELDPRKNSIYYYTVAQNVEYVDYVPEQAVQTFKRNIKSIVDIAGGYGIEPIIVRFNYNPQNEYSDGLIEGIKRNMEAVKRLVWKFVTVPNLTKDDFFDGCHFNTNGMKKIGKSVAEAIEQ